MVHRRERPLIAFFDHCDVFEDFYPPYGVDQEAFVTAWADTHAHAFLSVLQREIGDVVWYSFSVRPEVSEGRHEVVGCRVRLLQSSFVHRALWRGFYLPRWSWRWRRIYPMYAFLASYTSLLSSDFFRALKVDRPDVFFAQDYATGRFDELVLLSRRMSIPLIAYHSGSLPHRYTGRLAKRWTIPRATRLIASSRDELEMLAGRYRVSRDQLDLILTPIDTDKFRQINRTLACQAIGLDPALRYLLFVGRLDDRVKRIGALIRAMGSLSAAHEDARLLIVGEGSNGANLKRLAQSLAADRVSFLGWISDKQRLSRLYNVAECLLLPSVREGFPTVVGEAMACGTPVLASRVGGIPDLVIEGKSGWLIDPHDVDGLRERMAYVLSHPEMVSSMRPEVRKMAEASVGYPRTAEALRNCFEAARIVS